MKKLFNKYYVKFKEEATIEFENLEVAQKYLDKREAKLVKQIREDYLYVDILGEPVKVTKQKTKSMYKCQRVHICDRCRSDFRNYKDYAPGEAIMCDGPNCFSDAKKIEQEIKKRLENKLK